MFRWLRRLLGLEPDEETAEPTSEPASDRQFEGDEQVEASDSDDERVGEVTDDKRTGEVTDDNESPDDAAGERAGEPFHGDGPVDAPPGRGDETRETETDRDWLETMRAKRDQPYQDSQEHLLDELRRIDFLLWARIQQWRSETTDTPREFTGYYIADQKVDELLLPTANEQDWTLSNGLTDESVSAYAERLLEIITRRERLALERGTELRLETLTDRFECDRDSRDVLLFAVGPGIDPKYETVYAYLHDNLTRTRPTADLVLRARYRSTSERLKARALFEPTAPLRQHGLVRLANGEETPLPSRPLDVDDRIVNYLLGMDTLDESIAAFVDVRRPRLEFNGRVGSEPQLEGIYRPEYHIARGLRTRRRLDELILDTDVKTQLEQLAQQNGFNVYGATPPPVMAHFYGPYGSGKQQAAEALCGDRQRDLLVADVRGLVSNGVHEAVDRVLREARLRDAAVVVSHLDVLDDDDADIDLRALIRALDAFEGWVFLLGEQPLRASQRLGATAHQFVAVHFPIPSYDRRRELWEAVSDLPADVDVADLAGKFRLTGGQITDAVETARSRAYGTELTAEDVYAGCRLQSREKLGSLGRVVEPVYRWDDIVLPSDRKAHLEEVAVHIEHQGRVYTDWGFKEKFSLGNGVIALFTGPSGTGKTMAAEIIANEVGLDLYKIDLSSIVSKYIGETEKNLSQVFDEAENSNAILFFDEADALFGKRSEVSDAHDRYANIEINYLLQRVEEHDGAVILTTNFKRNIDEAFLRRIHLSVDFPRPDKAARKRIWENIFPVDKTPVGDLDYGFLSEFELTGGNIKNIAVASAFLAASGWQVGEKEGIRWAETEALREAVQGNATNGELTFDVLNTVEMEHVVWALRRELQKSGKLVRPEEFGEYRGLVV